MEHTTVALGDRSNDIDIPSIVHTAIAIPQQVASLERAMIVCTIVLAAVGIINAVLLVALLRTRARPVAAAGAPSIAESSAPAPSAADSPAANHTAYPKRRSRRARKRAPNAPGA